MRGQATFKAHEGEVLGMQLFQANSDSPDPGPLRLITSGAPPSTLLPQ